MQSRIRCDGLSTTAHGRSLLVTGSFGVARAQAGDDLVDGIKRADEAMYAAKANGRDRVESNLSTSVIPSPPPSSGAPIEEADLDLSLKVHR